MTFKLVYGAHTRQGYEKGAAKTRSEDSMHVNGAKRLFAVADGIGLTSRSHIASQIAVHTLNKQFNSAEPTTLLKALYEADKKIKARRTARQTGTTLTALHITEKGNAHIAHSGDSRLYRLREGVLEQLTPEHVYTSQLRGELSQAVGYLSNFDRPFSGTLDAKHNDVYLLCTDGIHRELTRAAILKILQSVTNGELTPVKAVKTLTTNSQGPECDDATAIVVKVLQMQKRKR